MNKLDQISKLITLRDWLKTMAQIKSGYGTRAVKVDDAITKHLDSVDFDNLDVSLIESANDKKLDILATSVLRVSETLESILVEMKQTRKPITYVDNDFDKTLQMVLDDNKELPKDMTYETPPMDLEVEDKTLLDLEEPIEVTTNDVQEVTLTDIIESQKLSEDEQVVLQEKINDLIKTPKKRGRKAKEQELVLVDIKEFKNDNLVWIESTSCERQTTPTQEVIIFDEIQDLEPIKERVFHNDVLGKFYDGEIKKELSKPEIIQQKEVVQDPDEKLLNESLSFDTKTDIKPVVKQTKLRNGFKKLK
jgi:hypothetical protein